LFANTTRVLNWASKYIWESFQASYLLEVYFHRINLDLVGHHEGTLHRCFLK